MRRNTTRRAYLNRKANERRKHYLESCWTCQVCHKREATQVHEIARGPAKKEAIMDRSAWLALCHQCHDLLGDYSKWPISRQIAAKMIADPEYCNPQRINSLKGTDACAIDWKDVARWLWMRET